MIWVEVGCDGLEHSNAGVQRGTYADEKFEK